MSWLCLQWDIGKWNLRVRFQCMQPYLFWCVTCLTQSEISLLKMIKPRLRTTRVEHSKPLLKQLHCTNSVSALLREIVVCCKAVLPKDDDEKRIACVVIIQFVFVTVFDTILKWTDNFQVIEFCVICEHFMTNRVLFSWWSIHMVFTKWTVHGTTLPLRNPKPWDICTTIHFKWKKRLKMSEKTIKSTEDDRFFMAQAWRWCWH